MTADDQRAQGVMSRFWNSVRNRFWVVPLFFAALATALGLGLAALDDRLETSFSVPFLFTGGPEGARAVLSAIITSMISFTGLVFSITIVVLQLTSSQFSPRVLRSFLRDWVNQIALGVFVATFVYALVVLRAVQGTADVDPFVPQLSVTAAFAFVLASVVVFLIYIDHIAQSIRVATIITRIARDTRDLLERRFPAAAEPPSRLPVPATGGRPVSADRPGVVQRVDEDALVRAADEHGATIFLVRSLGEFVPAGATLMEVHDAEVPDEDSLRAAVRLGTERSLEEDLGFGLRQLVDIAERALSPGINDPSTAVQVLDQLHDLLRRLATRELPPRQVTRNGRLLLDVPEPSFADYLALAIDEIAHWGEDAERVQRRLRAMLVDLRDAALPRHRPRITEALERIGGSVPSDEPPASDTGLR
ncbi:DUF2254 domain-containing protein [Mycobacterium sp. 4D054]|uniref:DUF2254 domain-containing protein n=1 Tax=Mycobacterium sp. 4D054 TaxID=3457440 RepID=UPI003FD241C4